MQLAVALSQLAKALDGVGAQFALVGGLAASARSEARFTRDIDVAVAIESDEQAEHLVWQLGQRGFKAIATVEQEATARLATARLSGDNGVVCDLVFATCGIESEIVRTAEPLEVFPETRIPTANVEALLAMKTLSVTPKRPRDLGDIRAMMLANPDFDEQQVARYLEMVEARGYARGQALLDKWRGLREQLGV